MAWIFSLSIECGTEQSAAEACAEHFRNFPMTLHTLASKAEVQVFQDFEENWWCAVCPTGVSRIGIVTADDANIMTELGILLYGRLQSAPAFRYALAGIEVDEFRTYSELIDDAAELGNQFPGLVLAESVWQAIGSPTAFHPFGSGYVWKRYEGEIYKPLSASPDLANKLNAILIAQ
ncbi:hypothetical protein Q2T42_22170 [Leptolyngbya boryana CZ1]|uniref:Uncharacterized protein n=1 Tax=Leptolyngbya boryana CZ1 TaxID=3060204 RepID=A0AA96WUN2_LEPBY|nr:hypothetical protein [Leptolyngbya boryana]WNZ44509.1 hypothetical protein Q2T42_22170 [Leptolyngbya boryana CZ1]